MGKYRRRRHYQHFRTAEGVDGAAVHKYLPIVVGDPALDYVEAAVLAGRVSNGRWEVRGKLDDFPWDGAAPQEGHFLIEGDVTDGRMDFMPSTPSCHTLGAYGMGSKRTLAAAYQHRRPHAV